MTLFVDMAPVVLLTMVTLVATATSVAALPPSIVIFDRPRAGLGNEELWAPPVVPQHELPSGQGVVRGGRVRDGGGIGEAGEAT